MNGAVLTEPVVPGSDIGVLFTGSLIDRTTVGEVPAIVSRIQDSVWIIGEHQFIINDNDPLRNGFRV